MAAKFFSGLFEEESVWIGWSIYWRFQLVTLFIALALQVFTYSPEVSFIAGALNALSTVAVLGFVVRRVGLERFEPSSFFETAMIGWAALWRYLLMGTPGLLAIGLFAAAVVVTFGSAWLALGAIPIAVLWMSASMGWAAGRVKKSLSAAVDGVEKQDEKEDGR
ncbi:MAG: hypothetical protein ACYC1U_05465 [Candidatus Aquicultorales bacterium]